MSDLIRLRYEAICAVCAAALPARSYADWDRAAKAATCVPCEAATRPPRRKLANMAGEAAAVEDAPAVVQAVGVAAALDTGIAGGSARRIADRQQAKRDLAKQHQDRATREAHPRIGNVLIKARNAMAEPEQPTSWQKGAAGEEAVGRRFERLTEEGFAVLHDRRKRGSKWNIDHIVVGPRGVYVIDAKHYSGLLEIRPAGTFLRPAPKRVFVKGRPQDARVAAMDWQVGWVRDAAGEQIAGCSDLVIAPT